MKRRNLVINGGDQEAVDNLKTYLRIKSVHPNINYDECISFLQKQADSAGLPYKIYHVAPDKPIFVMTWEGQDPSLSSIWLNSHMDVVPVYPEKWTHDPFAAETDSEGNIYARGAQDMKTIGILHLEAVKRLRKAGVTLKRTIHIAFVPEEEVGGVLGMRDFVKTDEYRKLNVGFTLDEGLPSPLETFVMFYGERFIWQIRVHCPGQQGHGSLLTQHPPGNKIDVIIQKFNQRRAEELKKFLENPLNPEIMTINLTVLEGGVQANVVPPEFTATYDLRIPASVDTVKLEEELNQWCKEAGEGVWIEFIIKDPKVENTKIDDSNKFWLAFKKATDELKIEVVPAVSTFATDARFVRQIGIPAFGFSPLNKTPLLAHDNDEFVNTDKFLTGIGIFEKVIPAVANVIS